MNDAYGYVGRGDSSRSLKERVEEKRLGEFVGNLATRLISTKRCAITRGEFEVSATGQFRYISTRDEALLVRELKI